MDLGYKAESQACVRPVADDVDPQARSLGKASAEVDSQPEGPGWWLYGFSCGNQRLQAQETRQFGPTLVPTALSGTTPRCERLCPSPAMHRDSGPQLYKRKSHGDI